MFTRTRLLLLVLAGLLGSGCDAFLSRRDTDKVMDWLTCDECTDGELAYVRDTLGWNARGPLRQVLLDYPQEYQDAAEISARAAWRARPGSPVDSTPFMNRFLSNYEAKLRRRAILGLAALGDTASLREAWDSVQSGFIGYRPDVSKLIERSLASAGAVGFAQLDVENITVTPDNVSLTVGATASLVARVTDANGDPATGPLTWTSSDPNVATVASPAWGHGVVTAAGPGTATVTVASRPASDFATIQVSPVPPPTPQLVIFSGDGQRDTVATTLDLPLVAELTLMGQPLVGITVSWEFIRGGPPGIVTSLTNNLGIATFKPTLGPNPGRVWITATAGGQTVRFQLLAHTP